METYPVSLRGIDPVKGIAGGRVEYVDDRAVRPEIAFDPGAIERRRAGRTRQCGNLQHVAAHGAPAE